MASGFKAQEEHAQNSTACGNAILPLLLLHLVPELLVERRPISRPGPIPLLPATRLDPLNSRDEATGQRLDALEDPFQLYRCPPTVMNCTDSVSERIEPSEGDRRRSKKLIVRAGVTRRGPPHRVTT